MDYPRIMLSAVKSGSGKTLITCGLLQALRNRNLNIRAFKCGPDYIDPMFHTKVLGFPCKNLDTFFTDEDVTGYLFASTAIEADFSVLEGVMGFYDGVAGISTQGSSYDLARITKTPVIMILDCKNKSADEVLGELKKLVEYRVGNGIKAVILNRINTEVSSQYKENCILDEIKKCIENEFRIEVLGAVPEMDNLHLESRHLGLVMPGEIDDLQERLNRLADILEENIDIDRVISLGNSALDYEVENYNQMLNDGRIVIEDNSKTEPVRIAIARDEAFCFYYEDNLRMLKNLGAELVEFSPIHDKKLPENINGIILGGGYPENFCKELSENTEMLDSIRDAYDKKIPIHAECGGFMYLHDSMEDVNGYTFEMAGIIKGKAAYKGKLVRFGYIETQFNEDTILGPKGTKSRAHEFHYFDSTNNGEAVHAKKPLRDKQWECVVANDHLFAGFPHIYYYANPQLAISFLRYCRDLKNVSNYNLLI